MKKPERCVDPVMKYCQGCPYGYTNYPEWVENYDDLQWADIEEGCIWGLEKTEPTEAELREFDDWYKRTLNDRYL